MPRGRTSLAAVAAALCLLAGCGSPAPRPRAASSTTSGAPPAATQAQRDAGAFLARYEGPDGRVSRPDQGGDTVSEGQAYAMLLAVASGDRGRFDAAWGWARANLLGPDGLMGWHWSGGRVADPQPASDADVEAAWALTVAARRFRGSSYASDAARLSSAALAGEVARTPVGSVLAAGPWATHPPVVWIDPSYLAPEAVNALAAGDGRWSAVADGDRHVAAALIGQGSALQLPPDWAVIDQSGFPKPSPPPHQGGAPRYGLDAERLPVLLAASCDAGDRSLAAALWPVISHLPDGGADTGYDLDGGGASGTPSPVGFVAAAATAAAAGQGDTARHLLDQAGGMAYYHSSYYGDAWAALGRVLLTTNLLGSCPPA